MATLGDALRAFKADPPPAVPGTPALRLPLPRAAAGAGLERASLINLYAQRLLRRASPLDETTVITVDGLLSGTLPTWCSWCDLAPLPELRRGLALIVAEDAYLGPASPWRVV